MTGLEVTVAAVLVVVGVVVISALCSHPGDDQDPRDPRKWL